MDIRWLKFKLIGRDRLLERMMLAQNLKAYKSSTETWGKTDTRQRDQPVQRPWDRLVLCVFKNEKQGS